TLRTDRMDMVTKFNQLMEGFIANDITLEWLHKNPQGSISNGSSICHYKLKKMDGIFVLGAYGVSRFTNWRYHEILESGDVTYEWYCQEMYFPKNRDSELEMLAHNQAGFDHIKAFGIEVNEL
ncbi:hypothetical protein, partial [Paraglaciecola sp.]|uniref:hypothetical protein n=1 Tax=Paraglaciecola sp. TaxID=1920173 RepID=UPI00273D20E9